MSNFSSQKLRKFKIYWIKFAAVQKQSERMPTILQTSEPDDLSSFGRDHPNNGKYEK